MDTPFLLKSEEKGKCVNRVPRYRPHGFSVSFFMNGKMYKTNIRCRRDGRQNARFRKINHPVEPGVQEGFRAMARSSLVPTIWGGRREILYAPVRIAWLCIWEMPERLERMLPESLALPPSWRKRGGGAKSRDVKVLELRRR